MKRKGLSALLFLFLFSGLAVGNARADQAFEEGARLGRTCAGCHGTNGASPGKLIPIIGGQVSDYLAITLQEFRDGTRPGSVMGNLAKGYTAEQDKQMAAFFAAQPWVNSPHAPDNVDKPKMAVMCLGCHGQQGEGLGHFPHLAGQHPAYLEQALLEYRAGARPNLQMMLVRSMPEESLKQLAEYFAALK
jgi:sulfide dehydrogenase cytochrome subunit